MAHRLPPAGKKTERTDHFMFYRVVGDDGPPKGSKCGRNCQPARDPTCKIKPKFNCRTDCQHFSKPEPIPPLCKCCRCTGEAPSTSKPRERSRPPPPLLPCASPHQSAGHRLVCWPVPNPHTCLCPMTCNDMIKEEYPHQHNGCPEEQQPQKERRKSHQPKQQSKNECRCPRANKAPNYKVECTCKITEIPRQQC